MKVVHITSSSRGGAGIAAKRLSDALVTLGVQSAYISKNHSLDFDQQQLSEDPVLTYQKLSGFKKLWVKLMQKIAPGPYVAFKRKLKVFANEGYETLSVPFSPYRLEEHPLVKEADIVHLHWAIELVDARFFKNLNKPIVWTLHDMNPFLGAFHYMTDKQRASKKLNTIDTLFRSHKMRQYRAINKLVIVSPSEWLKQAAIKSGMFPQDSFVKIANPISFDFEVKRKARI